MTVTVDSYNLKCKRATDALVLIAKDWEKWSDGTVTLKRRVDAAKGLWSFNLFEHDVSWTSSAAKYLRDMAKSGGTVVLAVNEGDRFSLNSTSCYVVAVSTEFPLTGTQNLRYFSATFREV